jgi:hypothetical protein
MAFVTGAFPDGYIINHDNDDWRKTKPWTAVLHLFDADGNHLGSEARIGGFDVEDPDKACHKAALQLREMFTPVRGKNPKRCDIYVKPFSGVLDGVSHSLLYEANQPEEDGPVFEYVTLEPLDIMFHPPWDSGEWSS